MRFGISTCLYQRERLRREHLLEFAECGFEAIELHADRRHFDYRDERAIDALAEWLRDSGLSLHGIHVPGDPRRGSTVSAIAESRERALDEVHAALQIAHRVSTAFLIIRLGIPGDQGARVRDDQRSVARRSLELIDGWATPLDVSVAIEVIANEISTPASLVRMLEDELELPRAGVCLDVGRAFLAGNVLDDAESLAGYLFTTHVHDTDGRTDARVAPFGGVIEWPAILMAMQKIGYEGRLVLDLDHGGSAASVLAGARRARQSFERLLMA